MKFIAIVSAISAMVSVVSAIGFADAAPAVIDIDNMKVRARGAAPPPISPSRLEYVAPEEAVADAEETE